MKQIDKEVKENFENVIEVEGKEGKFYVEKQSFMEKYEDCPMILVSMTNLQFIKRYDSCKKGPKNYDIKKEMDKKLTDMDIKNQNYIIHERKPKVGETGKLFGNDDYIKQLITPVDILEFDFNYSPSKKATSSSVQATCLQFPLKLAYAATAHKIQGLTVKKPSCLVLNLNTCLEPAMVYVMLSRVQSISQLFILNSLPTDKIEAHECAGHRTY